MDKFLFESALLFSVVILHFLYLFMIISKDGGVYEKEKSFC